MKKYSFAKMNGAGNDFIIIDKSESNEFNPDEKSFVKLCDRKRGIGADGLMLYSQANGSEFSLEFFNSDGRPGSLCGNGARCALLFHAEKTGKTGKVIQFLFNGTVYHGLVESPQKITFYMNPVREVTRGISLAVSGKNIKAAFADTGSPHVVILSEDCMNLTGEKSSDDSLNSLPVEALGSEIRHSNQFVPGGTNVNFTGRVGERMYIRTFERGVEAETLACGTGSVATAIILFEEGIAEPPVCLTTRGGDELIINFEKNSRNEFENITLTGPAEINFTGEFDKDFYLL